MDEPPLLIRCAILAAVLMLLWPASMTGADPGSPAFYYGWGDGYLGRHHAAWWHGYREFPPRVNLTYPGIATADWSIPFGTKLCIEIVSIPRWAKGELDYLVGRRAEGVVVDRMAPWVMEVLGPAVDLWPALSRELMGEEWTRIGTVDVVYEICE